MNALDILNPPTLFIEISRASWKVLNGGDYMEFPVEKLDQTALIAALRAFVNKKGWALRRRALVAIGARGVSLRRMNLPPSPKDELRRLLRMQIEAEFPLSPEELAWGWQLLGQDAGRQQVLVGAVKKDALKSATQILEACGITPSFTLAALARMALCPKLLPNCAVLQVGAVESELLTLEGGAPGSIRLILWGAESASPPPASLPGQLYLTGPNARHPGAASRLPNCTVVEFNGDASRAALAGMQKLEAPLLLQTAEAKPAAARMEVGKWAAAAALLLIAVLGFPYLEAILLKPHLVHKLAVIKADRARLPAIDHELEFLQYLQRNQPPYLDTIYLVSKAAPSGASFESFNLSRRGELSVRGKLQNAGQVTEFRSNLISSAWFSTVVVEEQTPTPDRQVTVRISAQVKPVDSRKPIPVETPKPSKT